MGGSGSSQAELSDAAGTALEQTCMTLKVKMTGRQNKDGFPQPAHPESDFCTKGKFGITPEMSVNFFSMFIYSTKASFTIHTPLQTWIFSKQL